jgi:tetratricopeptide (TPR) repeat protein
VDWVYAWAPAKRAFIALFETRKYDEVGKHIDEALARAKSTGLSGGQLRNLRRYGYLLRVAAAAGLKRVADAEKALSELESITRETPWDAYGVSMTNLARGCVALAKNDNQAALDHLSKCISEDLLCRWKLSEVQDILGDKQAAAKTREQIQNYRRRSATSIYIRSKVSESTR